MIIASCGHKISSDWSNDPKSLIEYKDYENSRHVIISAVFCKECIELYDSKGLIIKNKQEAINWLKNKKKHVR